ncbi:MAG TPA: nitrilase-related carbon-nitrogen hydrolase, partial [Gillisia sp.]|nr:nitrilase-related carbon-nitrogen hydrolase [Gillisia sp.]
MKENLNVAVIQMDLAWENIQKNLEIFSERIDAIRETVDLIILPEMFTTGFSMNAEPLAEENEGAAFKWMKNIATERDSAITGSVIVKEDGNYYNRLYFIFPNGDYKTYDKKHT